VEAGVVHIMKALALHTGAAQSTIEGDSLQLLFHMVALGVHTNEQNIPLHVAQLHRHVMQVLDSSTENK
jgi:hypothetical protein